MYELVNLKQQQTFENLAEMDRTIREYNKELSAPLYRTLRTLSQYSCKTIGVSHIKVETIAAKLEVSVRTISRHLKALKELGMITVVNTTRKKKGGKGANAYVINTKTMRKKLLNVISRMSYCNQPKKDGQTLSRQAMAHVNARKETLNLLSNIKTFISNGHRQRKINAKLARIENIKNLRQCPTNVPTDVYKLYAPFFTDDQIAGLYKSMTNRLDAYAYLSQDDIETIACNSFDALVRALRNHYKKGGAPVKNMFAFVSKVADRQALQVVSASMFDFL